MRNNRKGFSLIELLIVVAIILIIAAIAIPNLMRSKIAANQASAVASLRTLNTSSILYNTTYQTLPDKLSELAPGAPPTAAAADLIDAVLATGTKSGYIFVMAPVTVKGADYKVNADGVSASTGQVHYYTDNGLVIRYDPAAAATVASLPIGQ